MSKPKCGICVKYKNVFTLKILQPVYFYKHELFAVHFKFVLYLRTVCYMHYVCKHVAQCTNDACVTYRVPQKSFAIQ